VNKFFWASALVILLVLSANTHSTAQTYSVLYSFGNVTGDGISPSGTLARDSAGNLYGTTQSGGTQGVGIIFKLDSSNAETILYNFSLAPDAISPPYGVVRSNSGALYGSANGGRNGTQLGDGSIFKITASGTESVLHSFGNGTDGLNPSGGLIQDSKGNSYGVTVSGGTHGWGTLFKITPAGKETILYNFTLAAANPEGTLLLDQHGNFFGTTVSGGKYSFGTVYEFSAAGRFHVIYNFCPQPHCPDGSQPVAGLVQDSAGNLYGTTLNGGANLQGTVFKITPSGIETVLHSFGLAGGDGYAPIAGLVSDGLGNFYGTTFHGGANQAGTIFKIDSGGNENILYSFCVQPSCADGNGTGFGTLIRDGSGNLYGASGGGGSFQSGVVFKLTP